MEVDPEDERDVDERRDLKDNNYSENGYQFEGMGDNNSHSTELRDAVNPSSATEESENRVGRRDDFADDSSSRGITNNTDTHSEVEDNSVNKSDKDVSDESSISAMETDPPLEFDSCNVSSEIYDDTPEPETESNISRSVSEFDSRVHNSGRNEWVEPSMDHRDLPEKEQDVRIEISDEREKNDEFVSLRAEDYRVPRKVKDDYMDNSTSPGYQGRRDETSGQYHSQELRHDNSLRGERISDRRDSPPVKTSEFGRGTRSGHDFTQGRRDETSGQYHSQELKHEKSLRGERISDRRESPPVKTSEFGRGTRSGHDFSRGTSVSRNYGREEIYGHIVLFAPGRKFDRSSDFGLEEYGRNVVTRMSPLSKHDGIWEARIRQRTIMPSFNVVEKRKRLRGWAADSHLTVGEVPTRAKFNESSRYIYIRPTEHQGRSFRRFCYFVMEMDSVAQILCECDCLCDHFNLDSSLLGDVINFLLDIVKNECSWKQSVMVCFLLGRAKQVPVQQYRHSTYNASRRTWSNMERSISIEDIFVPTFCYADVLRCIDAAEFSSCSGKILGFIGEGCKFLLIHMQKDSLEWLKYLNLAKKLGIKLPYASSPPRGIKEEDIIEAYHMLSNSNEDYLRTYLPLLVQWAPTFKCVCSIAKWIDFENASSSIQTNIKQALEHAPALTNLREFDENSEVCCELYSERVWKKVTEHLLKAVQEINFCGKGDEELMDKFLETWNREENQAKVKLAFLDSVVKSRCPYVFDRFPVFLKILKNSIYSSADRKTLLIKWTNKFCSNCGASSTGISTIMRRMDYILEDFDRKDDIADKFVKVLSDNFQLIILQYASEIEKMKLGRFSREIFIRAAQTILPETTDDNPKTFFTCFHALLHGGTVKISETVEIILLSFLERLKSAATRMQYIPRSTTYDSMDDTVDINLEERRSMWDFLCMFHETLCLLMSSNISEMKRKEVDIVNDIHGVLLTLCNRIEKLSLRVQDATVIRDFEPREVLLQLFSAVSHERVNEWKNLLSTMERIIESDDDIRMRIHRVLQFLGVIEWNSSSVSEATNTLEEKGKERETCTLAELSSESYYEEFVECVNFSKDFSFPEISSSTILSNFGREFFQKCAESQEKATPNTVCQHEMKLLMRNFEEEAKGIADGGGLQVSRMLSLFHGVTGEDLNAELSVLQRFVTGKLQVKSLLRFIVNLSSDLERISSLLEFARMFRVQMEEHILSHCEETMTMASKDDVHLRVLKGRVEEDLDYPRFKPHHWNYLLALKGANNLVEFLRSNVDQDFRTLVDGVEEHSEQFVREDTVSSLLRVKDRLVPLLRLQANVKLSTVLNELKRIKNDDPDVFCEQLRTCVGHTHALKRLYERLANREYVTKEIVNSSLTSGKYHFEVRDGSCEMTMSCVDEGVETNYSLFDLQDLRSRAMLLKNSTKRDGDNSRNLFQEFVNNVDIVLRIVSLLEELSTSGHFEYRNEVKDPLLSKDLLKYAQELEDDLTQWRNALEYSRSRYFLLNFFHSFQLWDLYDGLSGNVDEQKMLDVEDLLRYVWSGATVSLQSINDVSKNIKCDFESVESILMSLGEFLSVFLKDYEKNERCEFPAKLDTKHNELVKVDHIVLGRMNNSDATINCIFSFFANYGWFPEPNQILFATYDTQWEELHLFLRRCFYSSESHLFCIVNIQELVFEIREKMTNEIRKLKKDGKNFRLLLLEDSSQCPVASSDIACAEVRSVEGLSDRDVRAILKEYGGDVCFVASSVPALGKTEFIRGSAFEKGISLSSIPVGGELSKSDIVSRLKKRRPRLHEAMHLDISTTRNVNLDGFLFELLVLRCASARTQVFCLHEIPVFVEIQNCQGRQLENTLKIAKLFGIQRLEWDISNVIVSTELRSPIQIVCNYLEHLETRIVEGQDLDFSKEGDIVNVLPPERCRELLDYHFCSKLADVNYSLLNTYIRVFAGQLIKMSHSLYFRVETLQKIMSSENPGEIRSLLVRSLSRVASDFARRSVDTYRTLQPKHVQLQDNEKVEDYSERYAGVISFSNMNHLIISFHSQDPHTLTVLYRKPEDVDENMKLLLESQNSMKQQDLVDYRILNQDELLGRLERIARYSIEKREYPSYVLTADNLVKMCLILMRIRMRVPVVIMGETGCGKTSLIRFLANVSKAQFFSLDIHAGTREEDIVQFVHEVENHANEHGETWAFLDEINTCDHLSTISDIVCHRSLHGKSIRPAVVFLTACNPYRKRSNTDKIEGLEGKIVKDYRSRLVYRVNPLPDSLIDYVWDYGAIEEDEPPYIQSMVGSLPYADVVADIIVEAHRYVREAENEVAAVSLRDVARFLRLVTFFREHLKKTEDQMEKFLRVKYRRIHRSKKIDTRAIILGIFLCYSCRFGDRVQRRNLLLRICEHSKRLFCESDFVQTVEDQEGLYLDSMQLPRGIARNEAVKENVFVLLVCILNKMPMFLVGKPGCSKSLSMQLIFANLRGQDSERQLFQKMPQLFVVSFQGSESCTSEGIRSAFKKAGKYAESNSSHNAVIPMVLLDEVGLAEISPHNPLKVLHSLLEPQDGKEMDVSVVGISNWALDAAKMNRATYLSRPDPSEEDLIDTGKEIAQNILDDSRTRGHSTRLRRCQEVLEKLTRAYLNYVDKQGKSNPDIRHFHGLRDYYSMVKYVAQARNPSECVNIAIQRNFGGLSAGNRKKMEEEFCKYFKDTTQKFPKWQVVKLIKENLEARENSRHLMLISAGSDAADMLYKFVLPSCRNEMVTIYGSKFEEDIGRGMDDYNYRILSRIILCMEAGNVLLLKGLDSIYGSLYDMLNQNYTVVGNKMNCRIALGSHSNPMCHVADSFRCIVLVNSKDVTTLDPPFLNRFEKQLFDLASVVYERIPNYAANVRELNEWITSLADIGGGEKKKFDTANMFVGFREGTTVRSLLLYFEKEKHSTELVRKCQEQLLWTASTDGIFRSQQSKLSKTESSQWIGETYFNKQCHFGLSSFIKQELKVGKESENSSQDAVGMRCAVHTFQDPSCDISTMIPRNLQCSFLKVGLVKSERELDIKVRNFWESDTDLLVIQCNMRTDYNRIDMTKFLVETHRQEYRRRMKSGKMPQSKQKHVVFVLHTHRELDTSWNWTFLCGYKLAYLETLESDVQFDFRFWNRDFRDVAAEPNMFREIMRRNIHWCLLCVRYPPGREVANRLLKLERNILDSPKLLDHIHRIVLEQVGKKEEEYLDWTVNVACNRQSLNENSNFLEALKSFVEDEIKKIIAMVFFVIERNSAFSSFFLNMDKPELQNHWIEMLNRCCKEFRCEIPTGMGCYGRLEPTPDDQLVFPFSSLISDTIDALQVEIDSIDSDDYCSRSTSMGNESWVTAAASTFKKLSGNLPEEFEKLYFQDFIQLHMGDIMISSKTKLKIMMWMLEMTYKGSESVMSVCLHWFWKWKRDSLVIIFRILNSVEPILNCEEIVRHPTEMNENSEPEEIWEEYIVFNTIEIVLRSLIPHANTLKALNGLSNWQDTAHCVLADITLLDPEEYPPLFDELRVCLDVADYTQGESFVSDIARTRVSSSESVLSDSILQKSLEAVAKSNYSDIKKSKHSLSLIRRFVFQDVREAPDVFRLIIKSIRSLFNKSTLGPVAQLLRDIVSPVLQEEFAVSSPFDIVNALSSMRDLQLVRMIDEEFLASETLDNTLNSLLCQIIQEICFDGNEEFEGIVVDVMEGGEMNAGDVINSIWSCVRYINSATEDPSVFKFAFSCAFVRYILQFYSTTVQQMENVQELVNSQNGVIENINALLEADEKWRVLTLRFMRGDNSTEWLRDRCEYLGQKKYALWLRKVRFEECRCLPWKPFLAYDGYSKMEELVAQFLITNSVEGLRNILADNSQRFLLCCALLDAIYFSSHAIGADSVSRIMNVLGSIEVPKLLQGMLKSFLSGNIRYEQDIQDCSRIVLEINSVSSEEDRARASVIAHILQVVLSVDTSPFLDLFKMDSNCSNRFFCAVPSNEVEEAVAVLFDETQTKGQTLGLYRCTCGFPYVVDACQRPTQETVCPKCKRTLGGLHHNVNVGQSRIQREDVQSDERKGYVLIEGQQNRTDDYFVRDLRPLAYRVLHFMVHVCLMGGCTVGTKSNRDLGQVMLSNQQSGDQALQLCCYAIENDWEAMRRLLDCRDTDLALDLHMICSHLHKMLHSGNAPTTLTDPTKRARFEELFRTQCVERAVKDSELRNNIQFGAQQGNRWDGLEVFLDEQIDPNLMESEFRSRWLPSTLCCPRYGSLDVMKTQFHLQSENVAEFPFLNLYYKYEGRLKYMINLLPLVEWSGIVTRRWNHLKTQNDLEKSTVKNFIESFEDKEGLEKKWNSFREAFLKMLPITTQFECHELVPDSVLSININSSILCSCLRKDGLSLFLYAMISNLIGIQNGFFDELKDEVSQNVKLADLCRKAGMPKYFSRISAHSSSESHLLVDKLEEYADAFSAPDPEYGSGHRMFYDLEMIELAVASEAMRGKVLFEPPEKLVKFSYSLENFNTNLWVFDELEKTVHQIDLHPAQRSTIEKSVDVPQSFDLMRSLLLIVQMVNISWDSISGESITLQQYCKDFIPSLERKFSSSFLKGVCVTQLKSLYELLEVVASDVIEEIIHPSYTETIPDAELIDVKSSIRTIKPTVFLSAVRKFILRCLCIEGGANGEAEIMFYLKEKSWWPQTTFLEGENEDVVETMLPQTLLVKHSLCLYNVLMEEVKRREEAARQRERSTAASSSGAAMSSHTQRLGKRIKSSDNKPRRKRGGRRTGF